MKEKSNLKVVNDEMLMPRGNVFQLAALMNKTYPDGSTIYSLHGNKFALAVNKTKNKFQSIINEIYSKDALPDKTLKDKFHEEKMKIIDRNVEKDAKGLPVVIPDPNNSGRKVYKMKDQKIFDEEIAALTGSEEFKEEFEKKDKIYNDFCNEFIDFAEIIHKVKEEDLPTDITSDIIDNISWMIIMQ